MKPLLLRLARKAGAGAVIARVNTVVRAASAFTHRAQFALQWGAPPNPEWFDHFLDQHYAWTKTRTPFPWERGLFNLLAIEEGADVLELCCGDGFNAHHFYSIRAGRVLAVDFDASAIEHAKRHFRARNVRYDVA